MDIDSFALFCCHWMTFCGHRNSRDTFGLQMLTSLSGNNDGGERKTTRTNSLRHQDNPLTCKQTKSGNSRFIIKPTSTDLVFVQNCRSKHTISLYVQTLMINIWKYFLHTACTICSLTDANDFLDLDAGRIDLLGKLPDSLIRIFIGERINVNPHSWKKQWM